MAHQESWSTDSVPADPAAGRWPPKGSASAVLPLAVFVGALTLFLCTLSAHYSEGEDSANWVYQVTYGPFRKLFHAHHIAFLGLCRVVYRLCLSVGYTGDASFPMKAINALAGALTLSLMVRPLRRLGADNRLILVWVAATAVSYGFWSYSTQPETYVLPLPAIVLGVSVVIGLAEDRFSPWSLALLGSLLAFATLIDQMHVVLIPSTAAAVILIWYRRRPEVPASRLLLGLASFGGAAALIIGVAYFGVTIGVFGLRNLGSIIEWSEGDAPKNLTTPLSISDPIKAFVGIARAVLGGHFVARFDVLYGLITRLIPAKLTIEERYLALQMSPYICFTCLVAAVVAAFSGAVILLSLVFPGRRQTYEQARRRRFFAVDAFASITLLSYYVFNFVWEPTNNEFWIAALPIAYIAVASMLARRPLANRRRVAGVFFAVSLFIANGLGSVLPQSRLECDYWYRANRFLIENAHAQDVVITDGGYVSDSYLRVYTRSTVVTVHLMQPDRLSWLLSDEQPGRIWVSSWAFEPFQDVEATGYFKRMRDPSAIHCILETLRGRLIKRDENPWQTIWQLER